jgi:putative transposase
VVGLPQKREALAQIQTQWPQVSQRRACQLVGASRTSVRYQPKGAGQAMRQAVRQVALKHPRYGHRRVAQKLEEKLERSESHRNVQRIMQRERLQIRMRKRKPRIRRQAAPNCEIVRPDELWAMDFVSDWSLGVRRQLRMLTILNCATREAPAVEVDYSLPSLSLDRCLVAFGELYRHRRTC